MRNKKAKFIRKQCYQEFTGDFKIAYTQDLFKRAGIGHLANPFKNWYRSVKREFRNKEF